VIPPLCVAFGNPRWRLGWDWDFPALERHWQPGMRTAEVRGWRSGGPRRVSVSWLCSAWRRGDLGVASGHLRVVVEGQSLSDGVRTRGNSHKLKCREFPLEIRKSFSHHEGCQNWNRFTRDVQAWARHDPERPTLAGLAVRPPGVPANLSYPVIQWMRVKTLRGNWREIFFLSMLFRLHSLKTCVQTGLVTTPRALTYSFHMSKCPRTYRKEWFSIYMGEAAGKGGKDLVLSHFPDDNRNASISVDED